jgi:hypothetical protein
MWEILGYILFIATFLAISRASMKWTPTTRNWFEGLVYFSILMAGSFGQNTDIGGVVFCLLIFSVELSGMLFPLPRLERMLPCVRVAAFRHGLWLLPIVWLPLILILLLFPEESYNWIKGLPMIPMILLLVSLVGGAIIFLPRHAITLLRQHPAICANGLWYDGALHEWSDYESFYWSEKESKVIVRLVYSEETVFFPSKRIVVPRESWEAAKELLGKNLASSGSVAVKARRA